MYEHCCKHANSKTNSISMYLRWISPLASRGNVRHLLGISLLFPPTSAPNGDDRQSAFGTRDDGTHLSLGAEKEGLGSVCISAPNTPHRVSSVYYLRLISESLTARLRCL